MKTFTKHHLQEDLIRYIDGNVSSEEKETIEQHLAGCTDCRDELDFIQGFNGTLRECDESAFPKGPCIPSELLVSHVAGEVDEETARRIRLHLLACNDCAGDYYALRRAEPKVWDIVLRAADQLIERWPTQRAHDEPDYVPQLAFAQVRGVPTLASPFRMTETLTDPETGSAHEVTLRVEAGLEPSTVQVVVLTEPVPQDWNLKLYADAYPETTPLSKSYIIVARDLAYGFYKLAVQKSGEDTEETVAEFRFTVEPFSRSEAINTALEYLREKEYVRALAILEDAAERHANDPEIWDMLCIARAVVSEDQSTYEEELEQIDAARVRGAQDFLKNTLSLIKRGLDKFGDRPALAFADAIDNPFSVQSFQNFSQRQLSLINIRALQILQERVSSMEKQNRPVPSLLTEIKSRLNDFPMLFAALELSINAVRDDTAIDVDEKFRKIGESLDRLISDLEKREIAPPDYGIDLRAKLGDGCWLWLGNQVQRMFVWTEALYWHLSGMPTASDPDFSPALFELCRGFELLLNIAVGKPCATIKDHLKNNPASVKEVQSQFPKLQLAQFLQYEAPTLSIPQIAHLLRSGFAVRTAIPGALGNDAEQFLDHAPGLAKAGFLEAIVQVGTYFRNGKIHAKPGSPWNFTSLDEIELLRKLILGLDEQRVDGTEIFQRIRSDNWLPRARAEHAAGALSQSWQGYTGLAKILWVALTTAEGKSHS